LKEELIVSASGIRGIVGHGLQVDTAQRYGAAFGGYLSESDAGNGGIVLVGRDSRPSGPDLAEAVTAGLLRTGWDVGDLGLVPTPTALLAVQDDPVARGGVVVTASHNPAEWNGLKLASPDGEFIAPEAGKAIQSRFEAGFTPSSPTSGRQTRVMGAIEAHVDRILALPLLSLDVISDRRLRIALDCVRGAGGLILPELLRRLGCEVVGIHLQPDGRFPRDPEPIASNLEELSALVRREGAEVGFAVDPDVDRLALVDETGRPIGEDWTLALAIELVLSRRSGPVVTNLSSSQCIEDAAARAGQLAYRAPVGEANVARRMAEVGAVVGGEGNGGVILPDLHATRDAPLAAALVTQLLSERNVGLGRIIGDLPAYHMVKRKVNRPSISLAMVYDQLESQARSGVEPDRQDGLRLTWPGRSEWLHVRPSGTEPIVRVIAEAPEASAALDLADWATELLTD
jgi:phosphomannomutase